MTGRLTALCVMVAFSGCGFGGGGSARCDLRPQTPQCTDWRNSLSPTWTVQQGVCASLNGANQGGTFAANETCPVTEMLGGCQTSSADGTKQTNWYYASEKYKTKDDARAECENNMSFVEPQ